jgi:ABC-type spermidine/putrescine transport system permease subunit II
MGVYYIAFIENMGSDREQFVHCCYRHDDQFDLGGSRCGCACALFIPRKGLDRGRIVCTDRGPRFCIRITFIRFGLTETITGVVLAHLSPSLPYMIRALMISFDTLGFEWEEQGRMLGAGRMRRFRHIVLPHILPGIIAGSGLSMLVSLSQYLITFLVGGGQIITIPILLFPFASGGDPAIAAAYTLVFAGLAAAALWGMDLCMRWYYKRR